MISSCFIHCQFFFPTAARLPCVRDGPDDTGRVREVPGARPQEVRRREARLLGQPQVSTITSTAYFNRDVWKNYN